MSDPRHIRFSQERITSPLDQRLHNPFPTGQPANYKTNVNRSKTKKWVEAKPYSYDGDDWGDYDEDDEYGVSQAPAPAPQAPTGLRQRGQGLANPGDRSFTDPQARAGGAPALARSNSFEAGDERRAFSTSATEPIAPRIDTSVGQAGNPVGVMAPPASSGPPPVVNSPTVLSPTSNYSRDQYSAGSGPGPLYNQFQSRQSSLNQSVTSDASPYVDPMQRRDFSESAMPPPLQMHVSPAPLGGSEQPSGAYFPPRKSSLSRPSPTGRRAPSLPRETTESTPVATRQRSNSDKPLPFIRPADIYARVEEELQRERSSMDSQRPSMDSLMRPSEEELQFRGARQQNNPDTFDANPSIEHDYDRGRGMRLAPLETVTERNSEYLPAFSLPPSDSPVTPRETTDEPSTANALTAAEASHMGLALPSLPDVRPISGFGDNLFASGRNPNATSNTTPTFNDPGQANRIHQPEVGQSPPTTLQHQSSLGFRSAVQDAFKRTDDNSVPATPVSKSNSLSASGPGVSRSNTDSTAGISPIMSRVPSGAHPAARAREESSTPAIAEESGSRPASSDTSYIVARKPSPSSHSRNVSGGSGIRAATPTGNRALDTPSPFESPARSPALHSGKQVPRASSGELDLVSPITSPNTTDYAMREADLASPAKSDDRRASAQAAEEERKAQSSFLENRKSIIAEPLSGGASPVSRADSPGKGRVRDLADRYNSDSRRNSAQSISSLKSNGSWVRGPEKTALRSPSPSKELSPERPRPETNLSFRPKLPGQWESYATTADASTPGDVIEERRLGSPLRDAQSTPPAQREPIGSPEKLEEADLTPTTAKRPVSTSEPNQAPNPVEDPMAALAAAGAAVGEAIKSSMGLEHDRSEPQSWEGSDASDEDNHTIEEEDKHRSVGDVFLRPLQLDRAASSIASSSAAPTPGLEDDRQIGGPRQHQDDDEMLLPAPLKSRSPSVIVEHELSVPSRPGLLPQLSSDPTAEDLESDRLRKEIVASLSPQTSFETREENRVSGLDSNNLTPDANRASSILPREYDSYWNGDAASQISRQTTQEDDAYRQAEATTAGEVRPAPLAHKFSWERSSGLPTPADAVPATTLTSVPSEEKQVYATDSTGGAALRTSLDHGAGGNLSVARSIAELPGRPTSAEGLHIVNPESLGDESPVELPAALPEPHEDVTGVTGFDEPTPLTQTPPPAAQSAAAEPARIPPFREILALKSADERIAAYNSTRQQFAGMDSGLRAWVNSTLAAKPEHADLRDIGTKPIAMPVSTGSGIIGSMRHRHGPSVSHIATGLRKGSATAATPGGTPYYQQYLDSASAVPAGNNTPSPVSNQNSPNAVTGAPGNSRLDREKMQAKGKDLLKGAGVLGGKGAKEMKGLFAKGRSRLRGSGDHKAQRSNTTGSATALQTQRAAAVTTEGAQTPTESGFPSAISTPLDAFSPISPGSQPMEAKRRRFSPFPRRRSKSRSRSRPTSLALSLSGPLTGPETTESRAPPPIVTTQSNLASPAVGPIEGSDVALALLAEEDFRRADAAVAEGASAPTALSGPANMSASAYVAPEAWDQSVEIPSAMEEQDDVMNLGVLPTPTTEMTMSLPLTSTAPHHTTAENMLDSVVRNSTPVSLTSGSDFPGNRASIERSGDVASRQDRRLSQETRKTMRATPPLLPVPLDEVARKSLDANMSLGEDVARDREFDVSPVDEHGGNTQGGADEGSSRRRTSVGSDVSREEVGAGEARAERNTDPQEESGDEDALLAVKLAQELRADDNSEHQELARVNMVSEPADAGVASGGFPGETNDRGRHEESIAHAPRTSQDDEDDAVLAVRLAEQLQNAGSLREEPSTEAFVEPDASGSISEPLNAGQFSNSEFPPRLPEEASLAQPKEDSDVPNSQTTQPSRAMSPGFALGAISAAAAQAVEEHQRTSETEESSMRSPTAIERHVRSRLDAERPLSYMPLPREDSGEPPQEQINRESMDQTWAGFDSEPYQLSSSSQYTGTQRERASEDTGYVHDPQEFLSVSQRPSQDTARQAPSDPRMHIQQQQMLARGLASPPPPIPTHVLMEEQRQVQGSMYSESQYSRPTGFTERSEDSRQYYNPHRFQSSPPKTPSYGQGREQPMFARQLIDPRIHSTEFQLPGVGPPPEQIPSPESRKSRGSIMRGRGGRTTPTPGMPVPMERINPAIASYPQRTPSYQSTLNSPKATEFPTAQHEQIQEPSQQSPPVVHKRSKSRNFFKRYSSGSTATLAALTSDSKADLSSPRTPTSAGGAATVAPNPPTGQTKGPAPSPEAVAAQLSSKKSRNVLQRNPTSTEADKKKRRFSTSLSNFFSRSGTVGHSQKPSKEEKQSFKEEKKPSKEEKKLKKAESKGKLQKSQKLSEQQKQSGTPQSAQQAFAAIPPVPADLRGGQGAYEETKAPDLKQRLDEEQTVPGSFSNSALDQREPTLPYIPPSPPPGDYEHEPQSAISEPALRVRSPDYQDQMYDTPDMRYASPPPPQPYYNHPETQARYYARGPSSRSISHDEQQQAQIGRWPAQAAQPQRRSSAQSPSIDSRRRGPPQLRHASTDDSADYRLSPQVSQLSGPVRRLHSGSDASSGVISPLEQRASPGFGVGVGVASARQGGGSGSPDPRPGRGMRSISETAQPPHQHQHHQQHQYYQQQERPWELSLPAAADADADADAEAEDAGEQAYRGGPVVHADMHDAADAAAEEEAQAHWAGFEEVLPRGSAAASARENRWQEVTPDEYAAEQLRLRQVAVQRGEYFAPQPPQREAPRYGPSVGARDLLAPRPGPPQLSGKVPLGAGAGEGEGMKGGVGVGVPVGVPVPAGPNVGDTSGGTARGFDDDDDDEEGLYAEPTVPPTRGSGTRAPMVEEEEPVVMHGASYPGMEWTPGWDGRVD